MSFAVLFAFEGYFRSICIREREFDYENTWFNFLHVDGYIAGQTFDRIEIFERCLCH